MSMASSKKKAGFVLALLLVALTLPGWGEEKAQQACYLHIRLCPDRVAGGDSLRRGGPEAGRVAGARR